MAALNGPAFTTDNSNVMTVIMKLIVQHTIAEGAVQTLNMTTNGRTARKTLENLFPGQGVLRSSVVKAESTIEKLLYFKKYP